MEFTTPSDGAGIGLDFSNLPWPFWRATFVLLNSADFKAASQTCRTLKTVSESPSAWSWEVKRVYSVIASVERKVRSLKARRKKVHSVLKSLHLFEPGELSCQKKVQLMER
ncbi:hypothetical protein BSKO_12940 [Bryopsis sp. KO-2023]|nr:hypothetical protein BSKO_12940 [Bryopsis sp. KO-2023]